MVRSPCLPKIGLTRGAWSPEEDALLVRYIQKHGEGDWRTLPTKAGISRCGKSCRLRWKNYLRPDIKRGNITEAEEDLIVRLHRLLGNRWSLIAGRLPGRTDNEIKNYWNTHLFKKLSKSDAEADIAAEKRRRNGGKREENTNTNITTTNNNNNNKIINNKNEVTVSEDCRKVKLYAPKPIRVSSLFMRSDGRPTSSSVGGGNRAEKKNKEDDSHAPSLTWSSLLELEDLPYDNNYGGDGNHRYSFAGDLNMLDIVYDQFRQLV